MKNLLIKSALLILVAALATPVSSPAADTAADLYKAKCGSCHGPDGAANTPMGKNLKLKDLGSADIQKMSDKELKDAIAKGKPPKMPGYAGKLTDTQIDDLVKHIRSMKK